MSEDQENPGGIDRLAHSACRDDLSALRLLRGDDVGPCLSLHDQRRDGIAALVLGEPPSGPAIGAQRRLRRRISFWTAARILDKNLVDLFHERDFAPVIRKC
jgi:hypothetical protein